MESYAIFQAKTELKPKLNSSQNVSIEFCPRGSSPVSGQLHHTTLPSNPSYMPFIVTGFSDRMNFAERVINSGHWDG